MGTIKRLNAMPKALQLVADLAVEHRYLIDVKTGEILAFDFRLDRNLFEYWKHAHFILDVLDVFYAGEEIKLEPLTLNK